MRAKLCFFSFFNPTNKRPEKSPLLEEIIITQKNSELTRGLFGQLPLEIILEIINQLDIKSLAKFIQTNTTLKQLFEQSSPIQLKQLLLYYDVVKLYKKQIEIQKQITETQPNCLSANLILDKDCSKAFGCAAFWIYVLIVLACAGITFVFVSQFTDKPYIPPLATMGVAFFGGGILATLGGCCYKHCETKAYQQNGAMYPLEKEKEQILAEIKKCL